jgi:hypothetical protein
MDYEAKNRIQEKYKNFASMIYEHGERFPKKHGEWVRIQYTNEYYFVIDSWNSCISMVKNPKYKDIYNGFTGTLVKIQDQSTFGINFGGCEVNITEDLLDFYIENLKKAIEE